MNDRALRLRLDVDVRGDDEVGLGAARTGPPGSLLRDGETAVVLGTALACAALAAVPADRRASVARDLAAFGAGEAAAGLTAQRVPGAAVVALRPEEQVGTRGWCARAVLAGGAASAGALVTVDAIRLPDDARTEEWATRVPWMVPALVRDVVGVAPDALARTVLALRALGEEIAADPARALDPATATRAAVMALGVARPVPGAGAFAPPVPPAAAVTAPAAVRRPPAATPPPRSPGAPRPDRRLLAALAAGLGVGGLALVLVFAIIASPAAFGLARTDEVNDRIAVVAAGLGQLRNDVGTLARAVQSGGASSSATDLRQLSDEVESLRRQVEGLCSVLPLVC